MTFIGWLHTAVRKDSRALALFADAKDLADRAGDGTIAATAASFRGPGPLAGPPAWLTIRASAAALATPGADPTQHTYDLLQTAQAYLRTSRTPGE
jgi:hypothetical protein